MIIVLNENSAKVHASGLTYLELRSLLLFIRPYLYAASSHIGYQLSIANNYPAVYCPTRACVKLSCVWLYAAAPAME